MKVIIAGGRGFVGRPEDREILCSALLKLGATEIVCGMARGADMFGYSVAKEMGLPIAEFPAEWDRFGYRAGMIRNAEMANYADALITFPGEQGTLNMVAEANRRGLPVIKIEWPRAPSGDLK